MPSWITYDYRCVDCEVVEIQMVDREAVPQILPCTHCGGMAGRLTSAQAATVSYPDGNRRFDGVRKQRELQKAEKKARKRGDKVTANKARQELRKL